VRNILIIRDNLWKTDRKMKDGLRCLIIYILLLTTKIYQHCLHYFRHYVCWLLLYSQDCILHWIYGMQINYITLLHYILKWRRSKFFCLFLIFKYLRNWIVSAHFCLCIKVWKIHKKHLHLCIILLPAGEFGRK